MDLLPVLRSAVRRWPVTLFFLALTGLVVFLGGTQVQPVYEATSSITLVAPEKEFNLAGKQVSVNAYARSGTAGQPLMALSLINILQSDAQKENFQSQGMLSDYNVSLNPLGGGEIIDVRVLSHSPEAATTDNDALRDAVTDALQRIQDGVNAPPETFVTARLLTPPVPLEILSGRYKAMIVISAMGIALTLAGVTLIDAVLRRKAKQTSSLTPEPAMSTSHDVPAQDAPHQGNIARTNDDDPSPPTVPLWPRQRPANTGGAHVADDHPLHESGERWSGGNASEPLPSPQQPPRSTLSTPPWQGVITSVNIDDL